MLFLFFSWVRRSGERCEAPPIGLAFGGAIFGIYMLIPGWAVLSDDLSAYVGDLYRYQLTSEEAGRIAFGGLVLFLGALAGWHLVPASFTTRLESSMNRVLRASPAMLFTLSALILAIAVVAFRVYTGGYGGLGSIRELSGAIRSGRDEMGSSTSFLQPFCGISSISFTIGVLLTRVQGYRVAGTLIAGSALLQSAAFASIQIGRVTTIAPLACSAIAWVSMRRKVFRLHRGIVAGIVAVPLGFSIIGQYVAPLLGRSEGSLSGDFLAAELAFPAVNVALVEDWEYRGWGLDLADGLWALVPQRLRAPGPASLSMRWTERMGAEVGEIPLDLASYGYLQAGIGGIALLGMLYGVAFRILEAGLLRRRNLAAVTTYGWVWFGFGFLSPIYGDPYHLTRRLFPLIAFLFLLILVSIVLPQGVGDEAAESRGDLAVPADS